MLDLQTIFNRSVSGLISQGRQAFDTLSGWGCLYRAPCGAKCALGILIPDEHYRESAEGYRVIYNGVQDPFLLKMCMDSGIDLTSSSVVSLVVDLQSMHDNWGYYTPMIPFVDHVKSKSIEIATKHGLTPIAV